MLERVARGGGKAGQGGQGAQAWAPCSRALTEGLDRGLGRSLGRGLGRGALSEPIIPIGQLSQ
jgi:hypothetical protein